MFEESILSIEEDAMRVELDKKSLFALASDTRVEILRSLQPMRRTVSQLSEELNIDKAAVYRHLKKMEDGGLVKRFEEHGFVYYGLSWKARDLLMPNENTKIIVLLSASWIFVGAVALLIILALTLSSTGIENGSEYGDSRNLGPQPALDDRFINEDQHGLTVAGWALFVSLGVAAACTGLLGFRKFARPRQRFPEKATGIDGGRETLGDD